VRELQFLLRRGGPVARIKAAARARVDDVALALQNKTVDGQENPLPTIQAKKFYEVQTYINLTGHIFEAQAGAAPAQARADPFA
jgi:hypothetical protein